jgi:hypothetical protein
MSEALSRRKHQSSQPKRDRLVEDVAVETGCETYAYSQSQRETLGSLAIKQAEVEKMITSGNATLKSLFELFRNAAQEGKRPKVKILSAYSVLVDPIVPAPGNIFPPSSTK